MMIGQVVEIRKNGAIISVRDDSEEKVIIVDLIFSSDYYVDEFRSQITAKLCTIQVHLCIIWMNLDWTELVFDPTTD